MVEVRVDGAASMNNFLAQTLADMLNVKVQRPLSIEATSLGAAQMAGLYVGFWTEQDFDHALEIDREFEPKISPEERDKRYAVWLDMVKRCMNIVNVK